MAASTCPVCGAGDQVLSVANVISGGISNARTFGAGYVDGRMAPFVAASESRTLLATRLMPPPPPGYLSAAGVMGPTWLFILVATVLFGIFWTHIDWTNPFSILLEGMIAMFPAVGVGLVGFLPIWLLLHWHPVKKRAWSMTCGYLSGCYYCARDDVMFDALGTFDHPESFVGRLFALGPSRFNSLTPGPRKG